MSLNTPPYFFFSMQMELMKLHKSFAVVVAALVPARLALRLVKDAPAALPGSLPEAWAGKLSHAAMYGFLLVMPGTGLVMGYYGGPKGKPGNGIPFFG